MARQQNSQSLHRTNLFIWCMLLGANVLYGGYTHQTCWYDVTKSFEENCLESDVTESNPVVDIQRPHKPFSFLGYMLASRLGVPACPLMIGKWIERAAKLGFDLFTYKTIRSSGKPSYEKPNICFVECQEQLMPDMPLRTVHAVTELSSDYLAFSNSMGNPSLDSEWALKDIARACQALQENQLLIVSVFGDGQESQERACDFANVAVSAINAGAHIIELNLSCPNVHGHLMYKDWQEVETIIKTVHAATKNIPLLIKVGTFDTKEQMCTIFRAAAHAGVSGITGINSMPVKVINQEGHPYFGEQRTISGLSGTPIHASALQFVKDARDIIDTEKLNLVILATGGVTKPEHFQEFLDAGATVTLSGTGFMYNPHIAVEYWQKYGGM